MFNSRSDVGSLVVIAAAMFNGKTEELIRLTKTFGFYKEAKVKYFKPETDTRDNDMIKSRALELSFPASMIPANNPNKIIELSKNMDVIGIDEAQFFNYELVDVVNELVLKRKKVYVSGLDLDAFGKPFGPMPFLMAYADQVIKPKTGVCMVCKNEIGTNSLFLKNGKVQPYTTNNVKIQETNESNNKKNEEEYFLVCRQDHKIQPRPLFTVMFAEMAGNYIKEYSAKKY